MHKFSGRDRPERHYWASVRECQLSARARSLHHGGTESRRKTKAKNNGFLVYFQVDGFHRAPEVTEKRSMDEMEVFGTMNRCTCIKKCEGEEAPIPLCTLFCPMKPTPSKANEEPIILSILLFSVTPCLRGAKVFCS